jgi:transposase
MRVLGEDAAEMLEYVPSHFKVIRHVRPKLSCTKCQKIVQAEAPSRPIARGLAGPGLLAHVLVSKYLECRYRHSQYYAAVRTMQVNSVRSSKNTGFTSVYSVSSSA